MGDLYSENILDHYHNPRNFGKLAKHTHSAQDANPVCGDEMEVQLVIGKDGKVKEAAFSGQGCAISMASASMLTDEVKGKTVEEVRKMDMEKLVKLIGIPLSPVRLKCALLPLYVIRQATGEKIRL